MADAYPQNFQNHTKTPTGFIVGAAFLILAILLILGGLATSGFTTSALLYGVGSLALCAGAGTALTLARTYCLKLQDRIIRLELEVRMARILPAELQEPARGLTIKQRVGLRFASDAELPALVRKVLDESIQDGKSIKRLVQNWQGDYQRV